MTSTSEGLQDTQKSEMRHFKIIDFLISPFRAESRLGFLFNNMLAMQRTTEGMAHRSCHVSLPEKR